MVLRLVEYFHAILTTCTACTLLIFRQVVFIFTVLAAAAVIFCRAIIALYEQQVTTIIFAVGMCIAGLAALMALCNDIFRNTLTQPLVKHKVLTDEFYRQSL